MTYRQIKAEEAWNIIPEDERAALQKLVDLAPLQSREKAQEAASALALARCRRARKKVLNARLDREMRVLVGARVPRSEYLAIRNEAVRRGQSMYRFIRETLYREVHWRF